MPSEILNKARAYEAKHGAAISPSPPPRPLQIGRAHV